LVDEEGLVKRTHLAVAVALLVTVVACGDDSSGSVARFCDAAQAAKTAQDAQQKAFDVADTPAPSSIQFVIEDFASKFAAMAAAAPKVIKADAATMNNAALQLLAIVRDNNYDVIAMIATPEFKVVSDTFAGAGYKAAHDRFQAYVDANCGLGTTTPST
jgi:hypothetical protein